MTVFSNTFQLFVLIRLMGTGLQVESYGTGTQVRYVTLMHALLCKGITIANLDLSSLSCMLVYLDDRLWNHAFSSLVLHTGKCINPWHRHQMIKPFLPEMVSCSCVGEEPP